MNRGIIIWALFLLAALLSASGYKWLLPAQALAGLCLGSILLSALSEWSAWRAGGSADRRMIISSGTVLVWLLCLSFLFAAGYFTASASGLAVIALSAALFFAAERGSAGTPLLSELVFMTAAAATISGSFAVPALLSHALLFALMAVILWLRLGRADALSASVAVVVPAVFAAAIYLYPANGVESAIAFMAVVRLIRPALARAA